MSNALYARTVPSKCEMTLLLRFFVLTVIFTSPWCVAEEDPLLRVTRTTLHNGLQVWLQENDSARTAHIRVTVKVGSRYEAASESGWAHFLEHMLFKGTDKRSVEELKRQIVAKGATHNGMTYAENTDYYITIPDKHIDFGLQWLEEILFHSLLDAERVEKERKVVSAEEHGGIPRFLEKLFLTGVGQPIQIRMYERYFPQAQRAARIVNHIDTIGRDELVAFHRQYYVPNNMAIIVVGHPDSDSVLNKIQELFGPLEARPVEAPDYIARPKQAEIDGPVKTFLMPPVGRTTHIRYGLWTEGAFDPDKTTLYVVRQYLHRQFQEAIRYREGLAYYQGVNLGELYSLWSDLRPMYAFAEVSRDKQVETEALQIMVELFEALRREPMTEEDLQEVKDILIERYLQSSEGDARLALSFRDHFLYRSEDEPLPDFIEDLNAVTTEGILEMAQVRFTQENMYIGIARPTLSYTQFGVLFLAGGGLIAVFLFLLGRKIKRLF